MRRFGIEVEFGGSTTAVIRELVVAGLSSRNGISSYIGNSDTEWIVKTDASVPGGGELVSPPLDFDNDEQREQVTRAFAALAAAGATTDRNAGIHVHVESRDLSAKQVAAVGRLFARFEDCIYRLASSGWNNIRPGARTYCRPLSSTQIAGLVRARTEQDVKNAYYGPGADYSHSHGHSSRYCGLNLHSHFYRGTIEFRVFNSTMNAVRAQTYIAVAVALVQDARNGNVRSVTKAYKLGDMKAGRVSEDAALFNFLQVLRYKAGMGLDDYRNVKRFWKDSKAQDAMPVY